MSICNICDLPGDTTENSLCTTCKCPNVQKTSDDPEIWTCSLCEKTFDKPVVPMNVCEPCRKTLGL